MNLFSAEDMVAGGRTHKLGEGDEEVQTSSYKISHRDIIDSIGNNNLVY